MISYDPIPFIQGMGYTEREASFLYLVAFHSGYFLRRQFDGFINRHSGAIAQHFLTKARENGHVTALDFGQQRHVYHLRYKSFYTLLEDPDSQNRRRKSDAEIKLRLMILDHILLHLAESFLGSREEKVQLFTEVLAISPIHLPVTKRSGSAFTDHTLISYDKEMKLPRFVFIDEGARSMARFERFLSGYDRLFRRLTRFELVYLADSDMNFAAATNLVQKSFPESIAKESHSLYPKGAEHLLSYFRVRSRYEAEIGGLTIEDFVLLRDGNQLYTEPDHATLYDEWRVKPFPATAIRQRVTSKTASTSFRTELLKLTYPIFTYRHLPKKPPAIDSIERSPMRSNSKDLTP